MDVAQDPEQARRLHKALKTLRDNPAVGGPLKEMAREVLSGRAGMRDVVESERYMGAIGGRLSEMKKASDEMTPEERERSREQAERFIAQQEEDEAREQAERDAPRNLPQTPQSPRRRGRMP